MFEVFEDHEHRPEVGIHRVEHERLPRNADRVRNAVGFLRDLLDPLHDLDCSFQRG